MSQIIMDTSFTGKTPLYCGKVRETYDLGDRLLMITSDRLSAFDVVFPNGIPDKGKVLTKLSLFWFDLTKSILPNHVLSSDVADLPEEFAPFAEQLEDRFMIVRKAKRVDIECVVRGYLAGSGWKEYQEKQTVCGIELPAGLQLGSKLPEPIFTPSTKEEKGMHDVNISFDNMCDLVGDNLAGTLRDKVLAIYNYAADYAEEKGIIIADTKMEFGLVDGDLIVIDELLTPDSSRFWPRAEWKPGGSQVSYDKQFIRDYLETLDWDKTPPAPEIPAYLVEKATTKYREIYSILTGKAFS